MGICWDCDSAFRRGIRVALDALGLGRAKARPYNTYNIWTRIPRNSCKEFHFFGYHPLPPPFLDLFILLDLRLRDLDLRILKELGGLGLLLAEAAEKRDGVAEHGVVGAGVLHGAVEFAFDAWYGLEKELAEVAEGGGGLVGDALFG